MLSHRNAHYWLWFLLFGVVSLIAEIVGGKGLTSESVWLMASGFLGLLFGAGRLSGRFSRGYDLLAGLVFTVMGIVGVLHNLGITLLTASSSLPGGTGANDTLFGLSLALPYALIHSVLGLTSLNLGMRSSSDAPVVAAPVNASAG
jgi:hypothetical protein